VSQRGREPDWTIRAAGLEDVEDLVRLNRAVQLLHVAAEPQHFIEPDPGEVHRWFEDALTRGAWAALLAQIASEPVGYALYELMERAPGTFTRGSRTMYLHQLGVEQSARGRGIGRALLQRVERLAVELDADQVALDTWAFHTAARAFFQRCGFDVFDLQLRRRPGPETEGR
jgi:diamine N-acetyltransferase